MPTSHKFSVNKLNQKGAFQIIFLILVLAGIGATVYLSQKTQIFRPKASLGQNIYIVDSSGNSITTTSSARIMIKVTAPDWTSGVSSSVATTKTNNNSQPLGKPNVAPKQVDFVCNACAADINKSGGVDIVDFSYLLLCFNKPATAIVNNKPCAPADINGDGTVNQADFTCLKSQFGKKCTQPNPTPTPSASPSATPSPTSAPVTTQNVILAEDPNFTVNKQTVNFTTNPFNYTFSSSAAGTKTLYAKFITSDGITTQNANPFPVSITLTAPSPTPQPLASTRISLITPSGNTTNSYVIADVMVFDRPSNTYTFRLSGNLVNLSPNTIYKVYICPRNVNGCATNISPQIRTSTTGTASFELNLFSQSNYPDNPISSIRVYTESPTPPCPFVGPSSTPCQLGNYSVPSINPSPTPTPTSTSTPTPTPTPIPTSTPAPVSSSKRVFVTSTTYNGNLGGLSGADAKCQTAANSVNLGGTWKAWLSDSTTSAGSRLTHSSVPYKLINGTIIVNNWDGLTSSSQQTLGNLLAPLNINEKGTYNPLGYFGNSSWTGTLPGGGILTPNCSNWTSSANTLTGYAGNPDSVHDWSISSTVTCASSAVSLYCFEQ